MKIASGALDDLFRAPDGVADLEAGVPERVEDEPDGVFCQPALGIDDEENVDVRVRRQLPSPVTSGGDER